MPIQEVLPGKGTCCERVKDLKGKNHQKERQYFILKDKASFIGKEEHGEDQCQENADNGQDRKTNESHMVVECQVTNLNYIPPEKKSNRSNHVNFR